MVTDDGGNILEEIEFNAYGEITGGGGNMPRTSISEVNSNNLSGLENLFVGSYGIKYDPKTDLHYMRFRWYSNDQMRFISPDLLLGINRYAYCDGNPINNIDSMGLETKNQIWGIKADEKTRQKEREMIEERKLIEKELNYYRLIYPEKFIFIDCGQSAQNVYTLVKSLNLKHYRPMVMTTGMDENFCPTGAVHTFVVLL